MLYNKEMVDDINLIQLTSNVLNSPLFYNCDTNLIIKNEELSKNEIVNKNDITHHIIYPNIINSSNKIDMNDITDNSASEIIDFNNNVTFVKKINILIDKILQDKNRTTDKLFIISAAYDNIYKKYNTISLTILIMSSITTLIEAFRLTIIEYLNNSKILEDKLYTITFIINIILLSMGTIITILSSIVRFRNYREIMEQLKDKQVALINYKNKYSRKYDFVVNKLATNQYTEEDYKLVYEKLNEYDMDIKMINVLEYLRNRDILKYNKYKADFEYDLNKIRVDNLVAIKKYERDKENEANKYKIHNAVMQRKDNIDKYFKMKKMDNIITNVNDKIMSKQNSIDVCDTQYNK